MFVQTIGLAVPERRYTKSDCWTAFAASAWIERLTPRSRAIVRAARTLVSSGIGGAAVPFNELSNHGEW